MAEAMVSQARPPLAEATNRVNSSISASEQPRNKSYDQPLSATTSDLHLKPSEATANRRSVQPGHSAGRVTSAPVQPASRPSPRSSVLTSPDVSNDDRRLSQVSYASTSSGRSKKGYKTHIGPWQLGRTLGKGSSARVRLCRHVQTNQFAAVKIVNRRMACLVQDSSLAALSKWDSSLPESINGEMRVPMAIEREVAILKLIEHPNIMKLYDIWENRSEIYLILEYIDQGDLFTFINSKGRLSEEVTVYFFRQIISAMTYCHSFNICHRDLKPENILITADLQIKIADFGMAALHQTDTHQLATACGSPHYAAPELLKNWQYRGDKADIWSMGVILYAMLSATLPFDDPDLRVMMSKTKKGQYEMPKGISPEAEDLIYRMLQVNPERRISLREIWRHPLVQRYDYLDDFGDNSGQLPDTRKGFQYTPVPKSEIDPQLLRQLRSMWHMFNEGDLALKLSCDEPNDQKAFYWLLYSYREKQLEDFKPELAHSMSDYHHLKPCVWKKRFSTCEFTQPHSSGQGRSVSRFTVISTMAETEAETVQSYDPYRSSRVLEPSESQSIPTKITIHRDGHSRVGSSTSQSTRPRSRSRHGRPPSRRTSTIRPQSSKGSMVSSRSNRQGISHVRGSGARKKRVDVVHIGGRSNSAKHVQRAARRHAIGPAAKHHSMNKIQKTRSQHSTRLQGAAGTPPHIREPAQVVAKRASLLFNDELRNFSSNIAKDCDEAFKTSLAEDVSFASSLAECEKKRRDSRVSLLSQDKAPQSSSKPWDTRPLPPVPTDDAIKSTSTNHFDSAQKEGGGKSGSDDNHHVRSKRRSIPDLLSLHNGRRIFSAPASNPTTKKATLALPSIHENAGINDKARIVSAPPHAPNDLSKVQDQSLEYLSQVEHTIRVVHSPTASPVKAPEPLKIRKKSSTIDAKASAQLLESQGSEDKPNHSLSQDSLDAAKRKKVSWFRRSSKTDVDTGLNTFDKTGKRASVASSEQQSQLETSSAGGNVRRKISFPFWKSNKARDSAMVIAEDSDDYSPMQQSTSAFPDGRHPAVSGGREVDPLKNRNIEVKQNWLAKLFRVKPATGHMCMVISRKRARQEIAILLREWRKYGIRGVQVDKERNIVFARVAAENHLRIKEVEFAAEIMTVIEHGKKHPLSIVRFTQERGAASSFYKVVDTMRMVFDSRNLLVVDKRKQKMMIKTLNSAMGDN